MKKVSYPLGKMLKRLLKNVNRKYPKLYIYFFVYTVAAGAYPFIEVLLPKYLIGELIKGDQAEVVRVILIVVIYFLVASIIGFFASFLHDISYPKITELRIDYVALMFDKVISLDYPYTEDAKFQSENERAVNAVGGNNFGLEEVYHQLFSLFAEVVTVVGFILLIGFLHPLILLGLFFHLVGRLWTNYRVHKYEYSRKKDLGKANRKKNYFHNTTHDFAYGKDIRLYHLKDRILHNYKIEILNLTNIHRSIKNKAYLLGFISLVSLIINETLVYGILVMKVLDGMSIANFSMYLAATITLSSLLHTIADRLSRIYTHGQYVHDFYQFIDEDLGEKGGDLPAVKEETLEVVFDNVSFKYPNTDVYILKNLNLRIEKGEKLAIVGINGAGKSTLVKLMMGLFPVTEGEIRINGQPLASYDKKALYSMFSVVFQDVNVLAFTIKENIACSSLEIDEDRVLESLKKVGLEEKVNGFEKGLDQILLKVIDEKGTEFSGGENQKLAIARALYKKGKMVIMDEPTAALDALAEAEIYQEFDELISGKTAVYISHRLASTKFCDRIAFFDRDGLKEYGSHDELMAKKGSYYEMFMVQGKYYQKGGEDHAQLEKD